MCNTNRRVCIVGGGPAGLAAAVVLARAGHEVVVVDCAIPPIDKACGEGLMPDGIMALSNIGIEIPPGVGFPFRGIRFADARSSVVADFPSGIARGVRRTVLHELLIRHVTSLGVSILWDAKHIRLTEHGVTVDGRFIKAHLIVGADGQNSAIRRQAGLDPIRHERRRYGFRAHYRIAPWSSYMELHWGSRSQIYVTPIAADEICVAVISRDPTLRLGRALGEFAELARQIRGAVTVSPEMGALSVSRVLRNVQRGNVVLVGDASGSVDAITGEGICLGFKQALALARAFDAGDIQTYQRQHRSLMKPTQTMAAFMLLLERNGQIQSRALAGLAGQPEVFESLLAIHVGASRFRDLYSWRLLNFAKAFLAA
jgi:2-polyprenyl-6-methoxyphenol hydroxylase-like FAD-dependent oxidoreductase